MGFCNCVLTGTKTCFNCSNYMPPSNVNLYPEKYFWEPIKDKRIRKTHKESKNEI